MSPWLVWIVATAVWIGMGTFFQSPVQALAVSGQSGKMDGTSDTPVQKEGPVSLSRKRKKELRKLQNQANKIWASQQVLVGEAGNIAREAGRQLGYYGREQLGPQVQATYGKYAQPYVSKSLDVSRDVLTNRVVPAAGAVVGSALSVWDAATDTRTRLAAGKGFALPDSKTYAKKAEKYGRDATKALSKKFAVLEPKKQKQGLGAGGVIAIILGVAAAAGVLYAAWQTLRADDELWVADDPLRAPDA